MNGTAQLGMYSSTIDKQRALPLFLLLAGLLASINYTYYLFLTIPGTISGFIYIVIIEFIAVGISFQLYELILASTLPEVTPPKLDPCLGEPSVALLCVTCDDSDSYILELLRRQDYMNLTLYVLDDSTSVIHKSQIDRSGLQVVRRGNRDGYKAGNLNHWLSAFGSRFKYFVVADADSLLSENFVTTMVAYAEHPANAKVAIFESIIRTWNCTTPFARLLDATSFVRERYRLRVNNRFGSNLSVGHNNLYRTSAIAESGGFRAEFIAEDFATSLSVTRRGRWSCLTVPVVSFERQPENITEFARRQRRWALQTFQLLKLDIPDVSWPLTLEIFRGIHHYCRPLALLVTLVLCTWTNIENASFLRSLPGGQHLQPPLTPASLFWLFWLILPLAGLLGLSIREKRRPSLLLRAWIFHGALFSVTAWDICRSLVRESARGLVFHVTGRSPAPPLADTILLTGPVGLMFLIAGVSTVFNPATIINLVWILPGVLAPLILHQIHKSD